MSRRRQRTRETKFKKFVKIDEKDIETYNSCIETLLHAGYFRARLQGLSPFDKIVGGLCWCISNAAVDVDVSIYFHEEPTLGQKAVISDGIVRSLRRMGCRMKIQSVQILGLDLPIIYQVLNWLIKRMLEVREENKERLRKYSEMQFQKEYTTPKDEATRKQIIQGRPYLSSIKGLYESKRRFKLKSRRKRKKAGGRTKFDLGHIQSTLLEYGQEYHFLKKKSKGGGDKIERTEAVEQEKRAKKDKQRIQKLKMKMSSIIDDAKNVGAEQLSKYVNLDSSKIAGLNVDFERMQQHIKETIDVSQNEEIIHSMEKKKKMKQIHHLKGILEEAKGRVKEQLQVVRERQARVEGLKQGNTKVRAKIGLLSNRLDGLDDEEKAVLTRLRELIELNENLKRSKKRFRGQCKTQLSDLNLEIEHLEEQLKRSADRENRQYTLSRIQKTKKLAEQKFKGLRNKLIKENKKELLLTRKIDEIPIASELSHYEKRFTELIVEVLGNDKETRKYFDTYNQQSKDLKYTERKFSLISNIKEKYEKSLKEKSKKYNNWVLESVKKSHLAVKESTSVVQKKMLDQKAIRDSKDKVYSDFVSKKRDYIRLLRSFEEACQENEKMAEELMEVKSNLKKLKEEEKKEEERMKLKLGLEKIAREKEERERRLQQKREQMEKKKQQAELERQQKRLQEAEDLNKEEDGEEGSEYETDSDFEEEGWEEEEEEEEEGEFESAEEEEFED